MQTFVWSSCYETGIELMDVQHQRLVGLINGLGDAIVSGKTADMNHLYAELLDYTQVHFSEEEQLMAVQQLDPKVIARHHRSHMQFVQKIAEMRPDGKASIDQIQDLNHYLASWLMRHILGEDKEIARSIAARSSTPILDQGDDSGAALLAAVLNMQGALSKANTSLESKIVERTVALQAANEELQMQRDELQRLLGANAELQLQFFQREKMASVGQLAAGVAHEINNPIGFVSSNLSSLGEYAEDLLAIIDAYGAVEPLIARDPCALAEIRCLKDKYDLDFVRKDLKHLLRESRDGLRRVTLIVQDLKDFSRADGDNWEIADLHKGLDSTINIVSSEIRQKAELRREYGELPALRCRPGQLNQVFMNLLINAAQAIERHGLITVRTGSADGWGWVEVCDSGCGIPAEKLAHIFEPFFTTKPIGVGTGLGLSMSYSIVQTHGGRIEIQSTLGEGSCFRVCLPLSTGADLM